MPFKSRAQRRKFAELLLKGEISEDTFEEWNRETGKTVLPERVKPKAAKAKRKATVKRKAKAKRSTKARTKRPARRKARTKRQA